MGVAQFIALHPGPNWVKSYSHRLSPAHHTRNSTPGTEVLMFKKLLSTSDDSTLTFMRVMLGIVFFPHGAQKVLGWFGGYGFSGTMGFFTTQLHVPAPFAFLAIMAEFAGSIALILG